MTRWSAIPAARSSAPLLKIKLYTVMGVLAFSSLCGLIAIVVALGAGKDDKVVAEAKVVLPEAQGEATTTAREFLAGRPITMRLADGMDPASLAGGTPMEGVSDVEWDGFDAYETEGRYVEWHRFLLTLPGQDPTKPKRMMLVVPVQLAGKARQPVLVAAPSLAPAPRPGTGAATRFDWSNYPTATESEQYRRLVDQWAAAYLAGDSPALTATVGDSRPEATYIGLGGLSVDGEVEITRTIAGGAGSGTYITRVVVPAKGPGGWVSRLEFDLLARDVESGAPSIKAWGQPGSGPDLKEYQNAVGV